jgi:hypothetical protein
MTDVLLMLIVVGMVVLALGVDAAALLACALRIVRVATRARQQASACSRGPLMKARPMLLPSPRHPTHPIRPP